MLFLIDNYIHNRDCILKKRRERDNYIFGMLFGFILLLLNIAIFLSTPDITFLNYTNAILMICGIVFIILATIYPNSLDVVHKIINFIANLISRIIFKFILAVIYFILVVPIGLLIKLKNKESINVKTTFIDCPDNSIVINTKKGLYNIFGIFKLFSNEHYALILPLVIILIIIGILLIFVQSSVVAPFIYTLF